MTATRVGRSVAVTVEGLVGGDHGGDTGALFLNGPSRWVSYPAFLRSSSTGRALLEPLQ